MISIYQMKPLFQKVLRPLVRKIADRGYTANQVTWAAVLLSAGYGGIILLLPFQWVLLFLPLVLLVRMALNAIDGMLAREFAMESRQGAIYNELGDVISDACLYLPLAALPVFSPYLVVAAVVVFICVEMTGVIAVQIGANRRYDGPFGKSDRAFVFAVIGIWVGLGYDPGIWMTLILLAMILLSAWTIWNRAKKALQEAGE